MKAMNLEKKMKTKTPFQCLVLLIALTIIPVLLHSHISYAECVPCQWDSEPDGDVDGDADIDSDFDADSECVPTEGSPETACDGIDNDCNGVIDDVDVAGDGFCDCLGIAILGRPGNHPDANVEDRFSDRGSSVTRILLEGAPDVVTDELLSSVNVVIIDQLERRLSAAEIGAIVPNRLIHDFGGAMLRFENGARGSFWVTQAAAGVENSLKIRVSGTKGTLEWLQEFPQALTFKPLQGPSQNRTPNGPGTLPLSGRCTRLVAGHPEGFPDGFRRDRFE